MNATDRIVIYEILFGIWEIEVLKMHRVFLKIAIMYAIFPECLPRFVFIQKIYTMINEIF